MLLEPRQIPNRRKHLVLAGIQTLLEKAFNRQTTRRGEIQIAPPRILLQGSHPSLIAAQIQTLPLDQRPEVNQDLIQVVANEPLLEQRITNLLGRNGAALQQILIVKHPHDRPVRADLLRGQVIELRESLEHPQSLTLNAPRRTDWKLKFGQ